VPAEAAHRADEVSSFVAMKNLIIFLFAGLLHNSSAHLQAYVGQCVFPKHAVAHDGNLRFTAAIPVFRTADVASEPTILQDFAPFRIADVDNGLIQLLEVPGSDHQNPLAGKVLGWVNPADFEEEDMRNCL